MLHYRIDMKFQESKMIIKKHSSLLYKRLNFDFRRPNKEFLLREIKSIIAFSKV